MSTDGETSAIEKPKHSNVIKAKDIIGQPLTVTGRIATRIGQFGLYKIVPTDKGELMVNEAATLYKQLEALSSAKVELKSFRIVEVLGQNNKYNIIEVL